MSAPRVLLITPDLMFGSKVEALILAAGFQPEIVAEAPTRGEDDDHGDALWILDLAQGNVAPEEVAGRGVPVLAFYSHVDAEVRRDALAAGIDAVVPRSRMLRDGRHLIADHARR